MSPLPALAMGIRAALARGRILASDRAKIAAVIILAAIYATLRYNVAKGVPWDDWPSYIANKVLAVTSLVLLAMAALRKLRGSGSTAILMRWGGGAALAHVLISFALFSPLYFDKLFAQGRLTLAGGISLFLAAVATVLLEVGARQARNWSEEQSRRAMTWLLALATAHTAIPSATGWLSPNTWPGLMPPLTLLATLPAMAVIAIMILTKERHQRGLASHSS